MEAFLIKMNGALHPASDNDREILKKFKTGEPVRVKVTRVRNYEFHKKYFALLNFAYDYWEPENECAEKNFDRFRKDVIILAGFHDAYVRLDGSTRIEPKSISFASMGEDDFEELYTKTIDVIVKYVLNNYTGDMLRSVLEQAEEFA
jgi:hypothetical protein